MWKRLGRKTARKISIDEHFAVASNVFGMPRQIRSSKSLEGPSMNWDRVEGNWKQVKGSIKEKWGKLTDDDLDLVAGKRDKLAGQIQERYGISKDEADKQLKDWEKSQK